MFNSLFLRLVVPVLVLWTVVVLPSPVSTGHGGVAATTQLTSKSVQLMITSQGGEHEHWWYRAGPLVLHAYIDYKTWKEHPTFDSRKGLFLNIGQSTPNVKFSPPPVVIELGELKDESKLMDEGKRILEWKMPLSVTKPGGTCMDFGRMVFEDFVQKNIIDEGVLNQFMTVYKERYIEVASVVIGKGSAAEPVTWSFPDVVTIPSSSASG
ncbi:hypothetical protein FB446DRAFT_749451 [Lentinula raphanica]|nr:hypothetical protein FB446DRAFT_749451 [Lentinula raphanica]